MEDIEMKFMRMAIEEARQSKPEDGCSHPKVGVVVVKDGNVLGKAFRGEIGLGEHAEFTVLERKLGNSPLAGATVFTTLEPCTTRNHPKIPCAERLIERKVARVVIGMLDPDSRITGRGQRLLRDANIITDFFANELMAAIEEMNREFTRSKQNMERIQVSDEELVTRNGDRSLDVWYKKVNVVYWNKNFPRPASEIFSHLVEVIGALSSLASEKKKAGIEPQTHVAKAFAWWLALCAKVGVRSVEDLLWDKYPGACPYCIQPKCAGSVCKDGKKKRSGPDWEALAGFAKTNRSQRPVRLSGWQAMFGAIYQPYTTYAPAFGRLMEEVGELSEAVRIFPAAPGYFLSESADVFAWLMHMQNILDEKTDIDVERRGVPLEQAVCRLYPDSCKDCGQQLCVCPPILASTIGRIARDIHFPKCSFAEEGRFMTPDVASRFFSTDSV